MRGDKQEESMSVGKETENNRMRPRFLGWANRHHKMSSMEMRKQKNVGLVD